MENSINQTAQPTENFFDLNKEFASAAGFSSILPGDRMLGGLRARIAQESEQHDYFRLVSDVTYHKILTGNMPVELRVISAADLVNYIDSKLGEIREEMLKPVPEKEYKYRPESPPLNAAGQPEGDFIYKELPSDEQMQKKQMLTEKKETEGLELIVDYNFYRMIIDGSAQWANEQERMSAKAMLAKRFKPLSGMEKGLVQGREPSNLEEMSWYDLPEAIVRYRFLFEEDPLKFFPLVRRAMQENERRHIIKSLRQPDSSGNAAKAALYKVLKHK